MNASRHLQKAINLYHQYEDEIAKVNKKLATKFDNIYIAMAPGDGFLIAYDEILATLPDDLEEFLKLSQEEAVDYIMKNSL